jgi:hypothetical protein
MFTAALLGLVNVVALGQTSFDEYFAANKNHQPGEREMAFLQTCGVKRSDTQIVYGLSTETEGFKFHHTPGLLNGRDEAKTDFFGSAEVWKVSGKPRFVNVWILIMDEGSESNEMFCLDERGEVTLQESLNASYAVESGAAEWIYIQRLTFDAAANKRLVRNGYVQKDGSPAVMPKLSREKAHDSKSVSGRSLANDVIAELSR